MARLRLKTDPRTMTTLEFQQFMTRKLDPCNKATCRENAVVLVSYPERWCVCGRCGTYHLKPELPLPGKPEPLPSVPKSQLITLEEWLDD